MLLLLLVQERRGDLACWVAVDMGFSVGQAWPTSLGVTGWGLVGEKVLWGRFRRCIYIPVGAVCLQAVVDLGTSFCSTASHVHHVCV